VSRGKLMVGVCTCGLSLAGQTSVWCCWLAVAAAAAAGKPPASACPCTCADCRPLAFFLPLYFPPCPAALTMTTAPTRPSPQTVRSGRGAPTQPPVRCPAGSLPAFPPACPLARGLCPATCSAYVSACLQVPQPCFFLPAPCRPHHGQHPQRSLRPHPRLSRPPRHGE
jgi:hypothetical protein